MQKKACARIFSVQPGPHWSNIKEPCKRTSPENVANFQAPPRKKQTSTINHHQWLQLQHGLLRWGLMPFNELLASPHKPCPIMGNCICHTHGPYNTQHLDIGVGLLGVNASCGKKCEGPFMKPPSAHAKFSASSPIAWLCIF